MIRWLPFICCAFIINKYATAQGNNAQNKAPKGPKESGIFYTDVPNHLYNIIIGRPTQNTVTVSILANDSIQGHIQYGTTIATMQSSSNTYDFVKGKTVFVPINKLLPNTKYYYQLVYNYQGKQLVSEVNSFQTQRAVNSDFTFTIQADSHLDENTSTDTYLQTLRNMASDSTDFLVDLGDTWMTDKYRSDYKDSYKQYVAQRYYFGTLCKSAALYATLGNHDGESGQQLKKGGTDKMTYWATTTRKSFYPNPSPSQIYSGNTYQEAGINYPENYYAWQWGNALFIVLDPFRFTSNNKNPWQRTLGSDQYQWLQTTLEKSTAKFKFVFIHNLVGGVDNKGIARGGVEAAKYFEWGGLDTSGINAFATYRSGWQMPIHQLLVKHHVNVVFHGHDHFFAKQALDGIVYQLLPQPGAFRYGNANSAKEYGYTSGTILNNPGYLRVHISNNKAIVDYVQTSTNNQYKNKEVLLSYTIDDGK